MINLSYRIYQDNGTMNQVSYRSKSVYDTGICDVISYGSDGYYRPGCSKTLKMTFDDFETMIYHYKDIFIVEKYNEKLQKYTRIGTVVNQN